MAPLFGKSDHLDHLSIIVFVFLWVPCTRGAAKGGGWCDSDCGGCECGIQPECGRWGAERGVEDNLCLIETSNDSSHASFFPSFVSFPFIVVTFPQHTASAPGSLASCFLLELKAVCCCCPRLQSSCFCSEEPRRRMEWREQRLTSVTPVLSW